MSEQRIEPKLRLNDAIDQDLTDAKITLNLLERLTQQNDHPQDSLFSSKELETLIRNCVHALILHLTKTIEEPPRNPEKNPKKETYNLESLINHMCHDDDKTMLRGECHKIRGNRVYGKLVEYRHNIIAHRNIEYRSSQAIAKEFAECKDYLLRNKERIEKLVDKINELQMNIASSRNKKRGLPSNVAIFEVIIKPSPSS